LDPGSICLVKEYAIKVKKKKLNFDISPFLVNKNILSKVFVALDEQAASKMAENNDNKFLFLLFVELERMNE